ncbi:MAG TPA: DUF615 domain-containing protein [Desulfobulbus sp.]|nr:DUF615 domain-containing protein [Desulfobulbus sp.]
MEVSRSEQKRRIRQLEKLVMELVTMPGPVLDRLPAPQEIIELLREAGAMKGGARKRQIKYITKRLRKEPVDELYGFVSSRRGAALEETRALHELEYLRDALLGEALEQQKLHRHRDADWEEEWPSRVAAEIGERFPAIDTRALTRLAWLYTRSRQKKYGREIFRLLRAAREQERFAAEGR